MSTAQLDRPATVAADPPAPGRSLTRRIGELRETSPGRLQLTLAVLLVLAVLTGLVAGLTANAAGSGTDDLGGRAQPLLVEAETIYKALADADTTAAQAFLTGGLEPPGLTQRYNDDLQLATTALTSPARRTSATGTTGAAIQTLAAGTAQYAELVATARANNRQGFPVGAAYLSEASALSKNTLLPQAQALFRAAQDEVDAGYADARSSWWVSLLTILLVALLVTLVVVQRRLSTMTHRTFNVPLVAATLVTAVLALLSAGILTLQHTHLHRAEADGSTPVALVAEARILALQERGDEALVLVNVSGGDENFTDADFENYHNTLAGPAGLLAKAAASVDGKARDQVQAAQAAHDDYYKLHRDVRKADQGGDYDGAVKLALSDGTNAAFGRFTDSLGNALDIDKATFTQQIAKAGNGLGLLTVAGPLLALVVCGLAIAGIRTRLEEYR